MGYEIGMNNWFDDRCYTPSLSLSFSLSLPPLRIVNLSSGMGRITYVSKERREEILSPELTEEKLSTIMEQFVQWVHDNDVHHVYCTYM